jgi:hypothetical protein
MFMFDIMCGKILLWLLFLAASALTLYRGAILSGVFKDPLMGHFRIYGPARPAYPLNQFLLTGAAASFLLGVLLTSLSVPGSYYQGLYPPLVFFVLAGMALVAWLIVRRHPVWRVMLPRWYSHLLRVSTRQERRLIGFAWLKIPRKMRWRLNGDQAAFQSWVDTVRITIIYGAYDPENPWKTWT